MTQRKSKVKINIEFPKPPTNPLRYIRVPYLVWYFRGRGWMYRHFDIDRTGIIYNLGIFWMLILGIRALDLFQGGGWMVLISSSLTYICSIVALSLILWKWVERYK